MNKTESGCCRVGDKCVIIQNRIRVEVANIYYEEIETDSCVCGENVRLELKNAEEVIVKQVTELKNIHVLLNKIKSQLQDLN